MRLAVAEASNSSTRGQLGQAVPSAASLGSPLRANAASAPIIAPESASRPPWLASVTITFAYSDGPKLPRMKGTSNACAAPYTSFQGAASCFQSKR